MTTPEGLNTKALKRLCSELGITAFKMSFEGTVGAHAARKAHSRRA